MDVTLLHSAATDVFVSNAARTALAHFAASSDALRAVQPALLAELPPPPAELTWIFGRDGSLTARRADGAWWAGCSLPLLAGRAVLNGLESSSAPACLLAPAHAGLLRAAQERAGEGAALLVVAPDAAELAMILHCDDFADAITAHRLWFAAGPHWTAMLRSLLDEHPGLATPTRFIKTKLLKDELATELIQKSQVVFAEVVAQRNELALQMMAAPPRRAGAAKRVQQVLLVAGSQYRLWEEAGRVLMRSLAAVAQTKPLSLQVRHFDLDDPLNSSPLALARAAQECDVVVAANLFRADAAAVVRPEIPWITWLTRPAATATAKAAAEPVDVLAVAEESWRSSAIADGWPADRTILAPWPELEIFAAAADEPHVAMLLDTAPIEMPASVADMSSHGLLWSQMEQELLENPLVIGDGDVMRYLADRAGRLGLTPEVLDRRRFIESLVLPAYAQGLARLLISRVPLRLHGRGWDAMPELADAAAGPVVDREGFERAVAAASALIYPWPLRHAHAMDACGKPVLHGGHGSAADLLQQAAKWIASPGKPPTHGSVVNQGLLASRLLSVVNGASGAAA